MVVVHVLFKVIAALLALVARLVKTLVLAVIMVLLTIAYVNAGSRRDAIADLMVLALDGKRPVESTVATVQPTRDGGYTVVAR